MTDRNYTLKRQDDQILLSIPPLKSSEPVRKDQESNTKTREIVIDLSQVSLPRSEREIAPSSLLLKVPEQIPGVAKISKAVEPEHPDIRLFLIRNIHGSEHFYINVHEVFSSLCGKPVLSPEQRALAAEVTEGQIKAVRTNLSEVLTAISYFNRNFQIQSVYLEGAYVDQKKNTPDDGTKPISEAIAIPTADELWRKLAEMNPKTPDELKEFQRQRQTILLQENARYNTGKSIFSSIPKDITILPTESKALLDIIDKDIRNDLITNCREDVLLEVVDKLEKKGDKISVVVFGGAHNFKDNVERFNKKNGKQIALTVLEPNSYRRDQEQMYGSMETALEKLGFKLPAEYKRMMREKLGDTSSE